MDLVDLMSEPYYKAKIKPEIIDIPKMKFIIVDGEGAPEIEDSEPTEFQTAMKILFGLIYTIKFWGKKFKLPPNYSSFTSTPVESLWWSKDSKEFDLNKPEDWQWRALIRVPDFVKDTFFNEVIERCIDQKQNFIYSKAKLISFNEGLSVQVIHIGPYNQEAPTIKKMHDYAQSNGYKLRGKHHELYFGDPRKTDPNKLKTILRNPVSKIS